MLPTRSKAIISLILIGTSVWIMTPIVRSGTVTSEYQADSLHVVQDGALIAYRAALDRPFSRMEKVVITAYASTPEETDDTPFETASGTETREGVIAANFLPFGTKVRIPELFGNAVFVVEDRMAARFSDRIDVWFPTATEAERFGLRHTEVEIEI